MDERNLNRAELMEQLHRELLEEVEERARIRQNAHLLRHASRCNDEHCQLQGCPEMKRLTQHWEANKSKVIGDCSLCGALFRICFEHADLCRVAHCDVPLCGMIKGIIRKNDQWMAHHLHQPWCPYTAAGG